MAAQSESLASLSRQLDEIKLDRAAAGQDFKSLSREDLERLLAEKAEITVQELAAASRAALPAATPLNAPAPSS